MMYNFYSLYSNLMCVSLTFVVITKVFNLVAYFLCSYMDECTKNTTMTTVGN